MKFIVKTMPWAGPVINNAPTTGIASQHFVTTFQKGVSGNVRWQYHDNGRMTFWNFSEIIVFFGINWLI